MFRRGGSRGRRGIREDRVGARGRGGGGGYGGAWWKGYTIWAEMVVVVVVVICHSRKNQCSVETSDWLKSPL